MGSTPMYKNLQRVVPVALLTRHGFTDVHLVRGGMIAWLEHGWPTDRGAEQSEFLS